MTNQKESPMPDYLTFRIMTFPYPLESHINWDSIARMAKEAGANFRAEWNTEGCTITIEWSDKEQPCQKP